MLNNKELSKLETLLHDLGIDLPESMGAEIAGIAIMRFCLAKSLREHRLNERRNYVEN